MILNQNARAVTCVSMCQAPEVGVGVGVMDGERGWRGFNGVCGRVNGVRGRVNGVCGRVNGVCGCINSVQCSVGTTDLPAVCLSCRDIPIGRSLPQHLQVLHGRSRCVRRRDRGRGWGTMNLPSVFCPKRTPVSIPEGASRALTVTINP